MGEDNSWALLVAGARADRAGRRGDPARPLEVLDALGELLYFNVYGPYETEEEASSQLEALKAITMLEGQHLPFRGLVLPMARSAADFGHDHS